MAAEKFLFPEVQNKIRWHPSKCLGKGSVHLFVKKLWISRGKWWQVGDDVIMQIPLLMNARHNVAFTWLHHHIWVVILLWTPLMSTLVQGSGSDQTGLILDTYGTKVYLQDYISNRNLKRNCPVFLPWPLCSLSHSKFNVKNSRYYFFYILILPFLLFAFLS